MRKINSPLLVFGITLAYFFVFSGAVEAAEDKWRFELTPYFWTAGLDVDTTTVNGRSASGDFDFGDILDNLDFAGSLHFEAWKGKWGFIIDEFYIDVGTEASFIPRIGPILNVDVDIKENILELAVAYHFDIQTPKISIEPIAGMRYGILETEIDLKLTTAQLPNFGETSRKLEDDEWWIEIFGGGRFIYRFSERFIFIFRGDLGGIKYGDQSVFTWHVFSGLDYRPWKSVSLKAGYKVYDFNYENGANASKFKFDAMMHGPIFGASFYF